MQSKINVQPLKKFANWVFPPLADMTELREKDAVRGMHPKKEQKTEPIPTAIISCVESVLPPFADGYKNVIQREKKTNEIR